jgi:hypothetical protein
LIAPNPSEDVMGRGGLSSGSVMFTWRTCACGSDRYA